MKKIYILIIAVLILTVLSGCLKKNAGLTGNSRTNDIISELIKENVLGGSSNTNITETNSPVEEAITQSSVTESSSESNSNFTSSGTASLEKSRLPVEPEVGIIRGSAASQEAVQTAVTQKKKAIRDRGVIMPEMSAASGTGAVSMAVPGNRNLFIEVGVDSTGQSASPRKYIKITVAAFSKGLSSARYADIYVYALPKGKGIKPSWHNLIAWGKNIDIINGQAEVTRYWNGANIDTDFLEQGDYNIYVINEIKDRELNVLRKDSRFWGMSEKAYLILY